MSVAFDPRDDLIVIPTRIAGPKGEADLRLALDTGASVSAVSRELLMSVGYQPSKAKKIIEVTTGSGVESAPKIVLRRITALDRQRKRFPVLCHTLPPSATVDGLLGLDFLRKRLLTIDFASGLVSLT